MVNKDGYGSNQPSSSMMFQKLPKNYHHVQTVYRMDGEKYISPYFFVAKPGGSTARAFCGTR